MKKQLFAALSASRIAVLAACLVMGSITAIAGGKDRFKVYLNTKLLVTEADFEKLSAVTRNLRLTSENSDDKLVVYYYHCGSPVDNRKISLTDGQGTSYCEWEFPGSENSTAMKIPVRDILQKLSRAGKDHGELRYFSSQLPAEGRELTPVKVENLSSASNALDSVPLTAAGILVIACAGGLVWLKTRTTGS
jgi:hypothetical protein